MRPSERPAHAARRGLLLSLLLMAAWPAMAFDLDALARQLAEPAVVRGQFVQEKHLRGLPQPLVSRGRFVLARGQGLLWQIGEPLALDYRITARGIAQRSDGAWQVQPNGAGGNRQQQLLLALLGGDIATLSADFTPQLDGTAEHWRLQLTPRGGLLAQVFEAIRVEGGAQVSRVEVSERQGDLTRVSLPDSAADTTLTEQERRDLGD